MQFLITLNKYYFDRFVKIFIYYILCTPFIDQIPLLLI